MWRKVRAAWSKFVRAAGGRAGAVRAVLHIGLLIAIVVTLFQALAFVYFVLAIAGLSAVLALDYLDDLPAQLARSWPGWSLVIGAAVWSFTPSVSERTGSDNFYSLAAQVIPVFLLAIALELKVFPKHIRDEPPRFAFLLLRCRATPLLPTPSFALRP